MIKFYFHHMAHKVRTVRPAGEKQPAHFTLLVEKISRYIHHGRSKESGIVEQKNSIQTMASKKESLRSHVCHNSM